MAERPFLIPISETLSDAWHKVKGTKGSIWVSLILWLLIYIVLEIFNQIIIFILPFISGLSDFIIQLIILLLQAGILYIGITRAFDRPFTYKMMFHTLKIKCALKLIGAYLLQVIIFLIIILIIIGIMFITIMLSESFPENNFLSWLNVPISIIGVCAMIYVGARMFLAISFILDRDVGPWQSIKLSFQATRRNFWRICVLYIIIWFFVLLSIIPFGIGLIWSVPWRYIVYGTMYKKLMANVTSQNF